MPGVLRGSKGADLCGWSEGSWKSDRGGAPPCQPGTLASELQLDSVGVEHLGKVLNRAVKGSDLVIFNRMALAAVLGRVAKWVSAEAERLIRRPLQESG